MTDPTDLGERDDVIFSDVRLHFDAEWGEGKATIGGVTGWAFVSCHHDDRDGVTTVRLVTRIGELSFHGPPDDVAGILRMLADEATAHAERVGRS